MASPPASPLAVAAAAPFKRRGKSRLTRGEFAMAAVDLGWGSAEEANRLVEELLRAGLLESEGGAVKPRFDVNSIEVPPGFRPPRVEKVEASGELFQKLLHRLESRGMGHGEAVAAVNRQHERHGKLVELEVAALLALREAGAPFEDIVNEVWNALFGRQLNT